MMASGLLFTHERPSRPVKVPAGYQRQPFRQCIIGKVRKLKAERQQFRIVRVHGVVRSRCLLPDSVGGNGDAGGLTGFTVNAA